MMSGKNESLTQVHLRSPRAAAIAGILFSVLMITAMVLLRNIGSAIPDGFNREWLETNAETASLALGLVPFAGLAFLWFTGVMRDWLGHREDRFLATVFLGSGIIFIVILFIWAATLGTMIGALGAHPKNLLGDDIFFVGAVFMNEILGNYALRIAGVYMVSIGTLWTRTGMMPRWLIMITYLLAIGFLLFADAIRDVRFIFPGWVFFMSVYILYCNYRRK